MPTTRKLKVKVREFPYSSQSCTISFSTFSILIERRSFHSLIYPQFLNNFYNYV